MDRCGCVLVLRDGHPHADDVAMDPTLCVEQDIPQPCSAGPGGLLVHLRLCVCWHFGTLLFGCVLCLCLLGVLRASFAFRISVYFVLLYCCLWILRAIDTSHMNEIFLDFFIVFRIVCYEHEGSDSVMIQVIPV